MKTNICHQAVLLALLMVMPCLAWAQKKELSQARTYLKSGKDFDKAEKLMTDLLQRDSASRMNKKVLATWYEAVMEQYKVANEKLYLNKSNSSTADTVAMYTLTHRLYTVAEKLDSVDMLPDEKGRVKPEYRKSHAQQLDVLRPNIFGGGSYNVRKHDYPTAYRFFETYIDAAHQPLFTGYDYQQRDSLISQAAYWATYSAFRMKDAERTLRYADMAPHGRVYGPRTLQYVCEAYLLQHDERSYVATLREGFQRYPRYYYFFPRLGDYYNAHQQLDSALVIADRALLVDSTSTLFLLARSVALLNLERYDECVKTSEQLIARCDTMPEPYFNIATAYLNQALELEKLNEPRRYRQQLVDLYQKARPFMETYRRLQPADRKRWAPALYRVYLNLNMGRQFEEIDRLMRE